MYKSVLYSRSSAYNNEVNYIFTERTRMLRELLFKELPYLRELSKKSPNNLVFTTINPKPEEDGKHTAYSIPLKTHRLSIQAHPEYEKLSDWFWIIGHFQKNNIYFDVCDAGVCCFELVSMNTNPQAPEDLIHSRPELFENFNSHVYELFKEYLLTDEQFEKKENDIMNKNIQDALALGNKRFHFLFRSKEAMDSSIKRIKANNLHKDPQVQIIVVMPKSLAGDLEQLDFVQGEVTYDVEDSLQNADVRFTERILEEGGILS